jgi:aminoglycoside/choline kinase family phosphotransferase
MKNHRSNLLRARIARLEASIVDARDKIAKARAELPQVEIAEKATEERAKKDKQERAKKNRSQQADQNARARQAIRMRKNGDTYAEIGAALGLSGMRAAQIIARAAYIAAGKNLERYRALLEEWSRQGKERRDRRGTCPPKT